MRIFRFVKQTFISTMMFFSYYLPSVRSLSLRIINHVKEDLKLLMLAIIILYFILLALKQVNVVAIVIILLIGTQKYVFLMLQKI